MRGGASRQRAMRYQSAKMNGAEAHPPLGTRPTAQPRTSTGFEAIPKKGWPDLTRR
jgi:hypothetical protein